MSDTPQADNRFNDFILFQAQNAGLFLGQLPNPTTGQHSVNLKAARTVLDCLEMLVSKTAGNLTDIESQLLDKALVNIRALYKEAKDLG